MTTTDFFYVGLAPVLVMGIANFAYLRRLKKHDEVLYRFCGIRRELMTYLRHSGFDLEKSEYVAARQLLDMLNHTIHHYNDHKTSLFDGRRFLRFLREYKKSVECVEVATTENVRINDLKRESVYALRHAFFAYTPFFRSEVILKILIFSLGIAALTGIDKVETLLKQINDATLFLKEESNNDRCLISH